MRAYWFLALLCWLPAWGQAPDDQLPPLRWSLGGSLAPFQVQGDVRPAGPGLSLGLVVHREVRPALDLRINLRAGQALGQDLEPATNFLPNPALNHERDPDSLLHYREGDVVFHNYRLRFANLMVVFQSNLNQLFRLQTRWDLFLSIGAGALLSLTQVDAIDEAAGTVYDYHPLTDLGDPSERREALTLLRDGTYETLAERDELGQTQIGDASLEMSFQLGGGGRYRWSEHWSAGLSLTYLFSGSDLLDGQQWKANGEASSDNDRLLLLSLCIMRNL